jgi:RNA polymerase sigma factor (sigma-70 family)
LQRNSQLEKLVKGCISLNRESQHKFYQHFYNFCFSTCITYCQTSDDAREVVNDGFLKIFKQLKNFTARYEDFELSLTGWIKRIMIHSSIDHYRKNKNFYFSTDVGDHVFEPFHTESSAIDKLSYDEIIKFIQRLSPAYRIVFSLCVIHGFKHEEIARELKISVGASKSNLFKARMNIQKMISGAAMANNGLL